MANIQKNVKIAETVLKKSHELNIDVNAKSRIGQTAFHYACGSSNIKLVEFMIDNAESIKLDLKATTSQGYTGLQMATFQGTFF